MAICPRTPNTTPRASARASSRAGCPRSRIRSPAAEVIDISKLSGDVIKFGAKVRITDEDSARSRPYQIVGVVESDINHGLLSITAPLARALIGKKVGDSVEVTTPRGSKATRSSTSHSAEHPLLPENRRVIILTPTIG